LSAVDSYFFSEFNKNIALIFNYFDEYNWHEATMVLRSFFWNDICDNYIEAIKYKFYLEDQKFRKASLKNALNLFYKILKVFSVLMPFISEEIYSILYKRFIGSKSIHLEKWPTPYENLSKELTEKGRLGFEIIKSLRMNKSKLQIPLNQELSKVIILTGNNDVIYLESLKEDIKNTIRIKNVEIMDKSIENSIKDKPDLKYDFEELNISTYFFK
jgi:valyl-tRNA synthetase